MRNSRTVGVVALIAVSALLMTGFAWESPPEQEKSLPGYETVFTIPIGDAGVHYSGIGPESRPWGPSSFRVAADGTFWIADTAGNRLVQFDQNGSLLAAIEMQEEVVAISDFSIDGDTFVILDASAPKPSIYRISQAGSILNRWALTSKPDSLTGIRVQESGIVVEQEGGAILSRLVVGNESEAATLVKSSFAGERVATSGNRFSISIGEKQRNEQVQNTLGRAVVLDSPSRRLVPVLVEEMVSSPTIRVDQTVWLYDQSLRPIGRARIPLADQYVYVERSVAVGPDGIIYTLLTAPDHASVVKLEPVRKLNPILQAPPKRSVVDFAGTANKSCIYRSTMIATVFQYLDNRRYLSSTNLSGTCSGRTKPHYLSTAGYYYSVPYDWGGNDTVAGFNSYMDSSSYRAGDIDTAASETCSRGVDCSGFVGRVWGKSAKYSTDTLRGISTLLSSTAVLVQGDIVNKVGDHTALFNRTSSSGAYWYESTIYLNRDQVIYAYHPWSYFNGYQPRRSLDVCGGQSQ